MLSDEEWLYNWKHGRQLASMYEYNNDEYGWEFTYDADGMRTKRSDGSTTYTYSYDGSRLSGMTVGSNELWFAYGATGIPMAVEYNGTIYYYVTNIQGDVVAILNSSGTAVVTYTYDAWGNILTTTDNSGVGLASKNPLRYRGYVYDQETGLYYLQSRYYNPAMGRFINADGYVSTGTGLLSFNMFAYCVNNPANMYDPSGYLQLALAGAGYVATAATIGGTNVWNPLGWIVIGTVVVVSVVVIAVDIYDSQNSFAISSEADPYARPGQKKQGRERKSKARRSKDWKPRSNPKPPKKHTPGRDHRKYK